MCATACKHPRFQQMTASAKLPTTADICATQAILDGTVRCTCIQSIPMRHGCVGQQLWWCRARMSSQQQPQQPITPSRTTQQPSTNLPDTCCMQPQRHSTQHTQDPSASLPPAATCHRHCSTPQPLNHAAEQPPGSDNSTHPYQIIPQPHTTW